MAPVPSDQHPDAVVATWIDAVRLAAGDSPVLLLLINGQVQARSADGKVTRRIAAGQVQDALFDATLDLIWVRRPGRLDVVDLRKSTPSSAPIVSRMSDEGDFSIEMKGERTLEAPRACVVNGSTFLKWGERSSVSILGFDEGEPPRPKLVGRSWLAKELDRLARKVNVTRRHMPGGESEQVVTLPAKVGKCPEPKECGTAIPFGETGWQLIYAGEDEGADCQHDRCLLRDPAAGTFAKPMVPSKWSPKPTNALVGPCGLYRFDSSGKWYAIQNKVCAIGGACQTLGDAHLLGWLDGEQDIGSDE